MSFSGLLTSGIIISALTSHLALAAPAVVVAPIQPVPKDPDVIASNKVPSGARVYTVKMAVEQAIANNPNLKTTREVINQDKALTNLTRSALFPNLSLTASGGPAQSALNTQSPLFNGTTYNTYNTTLTLIQPLYYYGAISAVDQADYQRRIQVTTVETAERTLAINVVASFYNIILNERLLINLKQSKNVLQKALEVTNYRERIGRAQLLDVLQAKTQIAAVQPQIESARNAYETAAAQLATYMGISGKQTDIAIRGHLKTLLLGEVEKRIDYKNYYLPEIEANHLQIQQLDDAKMVDEGKYLPTLKFQGNYMFNSYTSSDMFGNDASSWNAAVVLNIPLFEGLASRYDAASYASQELQLYSARRDLENTLNLNQITSRKSLETAETSMISAVEADRLAQASLVEATRQYKLATIDFLQYLTIQSAAFTAASSLDQIKYTSLTSYANYFAASGQPLSILINILTEGE
jgi:outer membrane protein